MQDRYKLIQQRFDELDNINSRMSGTGGEVGGLEELPCTIKEQRDDFSCQNSAQRKALE